MERDGPQDGRVDRRAFLQRMSGLTAAGGLLAVVPDRGMARVHPSPLRLPRVAQSEVRFRARQVVDPTELTLAEAGVLILDGDLSPTELLDAYLARIRTWDSTLRAFNLVREEGARKEARRFERSPYRGALHGIPVAIKDNFYTAGTPTTANSFIFQDFIPEYDATAVARLRASGAIVIGKTQMGPLATTRASTPTGERTTTNAWAPHDPDVSPGGSSSGSATAVAARCAGSSTGTQTGGSITSPSLAQGLTGIKPTMGRVSLHGVIPLTYTRDHPGPLARDAMDAAIMLQAMAGPDPADPRTLGLPAVPDYVEAAQPVERGGAPGLRWPTTVGVVPGYTEPSVPDFFRQPPPDDETEAERLRREQRERRRSRRAYDEGRRRVAMLQTLERLGARVVEVTLPDGWDQLTASAFNNVRLPERTEPFLEHLRADVRRFGVSLSPWINGLLLPATEYVRGQRAKMLLLERVLDQLFSQCDVVVQTQPFPFDMIGLPLIAFPIGFEGSSGMDLPVGAMLGAPPFGEERLLSVAAGYQSVTDWHRRRPADPTGSDDGEPPRRDAGRIDALDVMELGQ